MNAPATVTVLQQWTTAMLNVILQTRFNLRHHVLGYRVWTSNKVPYRAIGLNLNLDLQEVG